MPRRSNRPIVGLGADVVSVARIERMLGRLTPWGVRLIFARDEIRHLGRGAEFAAGRIAVKEAVLKAAGLGLGAGMRRFSEIQTSTDASGAPVVETFGVVAELLRREGVRRVLATISHERSHALAVVILTP
jgi:holo-[acyl-carrier protein] synthase